MKKIKVYLRPLVIKINLPTVMKTAILQGESTERLFIATQIGEIFYIGNGTVRIFLDIRSRILKPGDSNGYDERGLLGLAFHPQFHSNGLFYLHYSVAGTQGPGALPGHFQPDPCNPATLNLEWLNRETHYDHIDTVEEWILHSNHQVEKRRTLLNIRRPFLNHNGFNSLNFSPETGKLVLTTGDGGSSYDPFNLSQNNMEIAGKIIEMDVNNNLFIDNLPVVTRFDELPVPVQETLTVIAKGVRNIPGISFQRMKPPVRRVLAYTRLRTDCRLNDFSIIETDYDFGSQSAYYVGLGTNTDQTRLFLGVYGSMKVTDLNQGTIFEVI